MLRTFYFPLDTCWLVSRLRYNCRGAADSQKKRSKFRVEVFVAAANQELSVCNYLEDCPSEMQWLRRNPRTVAIVNAVMATLKKHAVTSEHVLLRIFNRLPSLNDGERVESGTSNSEESLAAVRVNNPVSHSVPEQPVPFAEKLIEERLDRRQAQYIFTYHHLPSGHSPTPVCVIRIVFDDRTDRESYIIEKVGKIGRFVSALCDNRGRDDIRIGITKICVHCPDSKHPGAAEKVGTEHLLYVTGARERIRVSDNGASSSNVLVEMFQGCRRHNLLQSRMRDIPPWVARAV